MKDSVISNSMKIRFILNNYERYDTLEKLIDIVANLDVNELYTNAPDGPDGKHWPTEWERDAAFTQRLMTLQNLLRSCSKELCILRPPASDVLASDVLGQGMP